MPVNYELTLNFMGILLLALCVFIFFIVRDQFKEKSKYYHFDDDEKNELIYLMSVSLTRKTPLEEWKNYLTKLGVTEEQFNELLSKVQNKILNP